MCITMGYQTMPPQGRRLQPIVKTDFGSLLETLRRNRMMTQTDLSHRARVAASVIGGLERGRRLRWHPSTALRLYKALAEEQSLTVSEARRFAALAGLSPQALRPPWVTPDPMPDPLPTPEHYQALAAAAGDNLLIRLHAAAGHLALHVGYHRAIAMIDGLRAALSAPEAPTAATPEALNAPASGPDRRPA